MSSYRQQLSLLALAVGLLLVAFFEPHVQLEGVAYRYVYVFDISQSMNVEDIPGQEGQISRLEFAKKAATDTLTLLPCGTEVGLALFTGHRVFLLLTPIEICANQLELNGVIKNVDWRMTWKNRSEIAKAIHKSINLLAQLPDKTNLVFFTDGHEAPPIHPDLAKKFAGEKGAVGGLIVGVGGEQLSPIPKFDKNGEQIGFWEAADVTHVDSFTASQIAREGSIATQTGTEHLSSLRESYLKAIAEDTGLQYRKLEQASKFVGHLQVKTLGMPKIAETNLNWLLALGALILLICMLYAQRPKSIS